MKKQISKELADKLYQSRVQLRGAFDRGEYDRVREMLKEDWQMLPEPRTEWGDSLSLASSGMLLSLWMKQYDEARYWAEVAYQCEGERPNQFREFDAGMIEFEAQEFDKAFERFQTSYKLDQFRAFRDQPSKYLAFFRHARMKEETPEAIGLRITAPYPHAGPADIKRRK